MKIRKRNMQKCSHFPPPSRREIWPLFLSQVFEHGLVRSIAQQVYNRKIRFRERTTLKGLGAKSKVFLFFEKN